MDQLDNAAFNSFQAGVGQTEAKLHYLRSANSGDDPVRLRGAAKELEAYFIHTLMREMRKTIPKNSILSGGKTEEIFQDFLDEELAGQLARSNRLGLADQIFESLQILLKQKPENADKHL